MRAGDLIRNTFNGQVGIVVREAKVNGPCPVWFVTMSDGKIRRFQKYQMEVVSEGR